MRDELKKIKEAAVQALEEAASMDYLNEQRVRFLGKKGELTTILKGMGKLSDEERPLMGQLANEVRDEINKLLSGEGEEEPIGETGGPGGSGGSGGGETGGIPAGGKYDDLPKSVKTIVYRKLRDNLLALVRRRLGFGIDLRSMVPSIPKNITSGSIRNLEKIISKVKTDYRYLDKTRGYRGRSR